MSILNDIFGLHRDLDAVALDKVELMSLKLKSLYDNLNHLKIILGMIEKAKREGVPVKETIRQNLLDTLNAVKKELEVELRLEEQARRVERQERKVEESPRKYYEISRKLILKRRHDNEYTIGSSTRGDLTIPGLAQKQVGLWGVKGGGISIASYGRALEVVTLSNIITFDSRNDVKVFKDKMFTLRITGSQGIIRVRVAD
jgi:hypothetical protein